jgi:hypothetical protein
MKALHLHIDRIVVEGLSESGQRRFARVLESQLQALAESGIADHFTRNTRKRLQALDVGQLRAGATAEQAAAQVIRSIRQSVFGKGQAGQTEQAARPSVAASAPMKSGGGEARTHA